MSVQRRPLRISRSPSSPTAASATSPLESSVAADSTVAVPADATSAIRADAVAAAPQSLVPAALCPRPPLEPASPKRDRAALLLASPRGAAVVVNDNHLDGQTPAAQSERRASASALFFSPDAPALLAVDSAIPSEVDGVEVSLRLQYVLECERQRLHVNRSLALMLPRAGTDPALLVQLLPLLEASRAETDAGMAAASSSAFFAASSRLGASGVGAASPPRSVAAPPTEQQWRQYYALPADGGGPSPSKSTMMMMAASMSSSSLSPTRTGRTPSSSVMNPGSPGSPTGAIVRSSSVMFGASTDAAANSVKNGSNGSSVYTCLDCSNNVLGPRGIFPLLPILRRLAPTLRHLRFARCNIDDNSAAQLIELLPQMPLLQDLDLRDNAHLTHDVTGKGLHKVVLAKLVKRDREEERRRKAVAARAALQDKEHSAREEIAAEQVAECPSPPEHPVTAAAAVEQSESQPEAQPQQQQHEQQVQRAAAPAASAIVVTAPIVGFMEQEYRSPMLLLQPVVTEAAQPAAVAAAAAASAADAASSSTDQAEQLQQQQPPSAVREPILPRILVSGTSINAALAARIEQPDSTQHTFSMMALDNFGQVVLEARTRKLIAEHAATARAIEAEEERERAPLSVAYEQDTVVATEQRHVKAAVDAKTWIRELQEQNAREKAAREAAAAEEEEEERRRKAREEAEKSKCVIQ